MAGVGGVSCRRQTNNRITLEFNHSSSLKTFKRKRQAVSKKAIDFGCDATLNTETETNSCRSSFECSFSSNTFYSDHHLFSGWNVALLHWRTFGRSNVCLLLFHFDSINPNSERFDCKSNWRKLKLASTQNANFVHPLLPQSQFILTPLFSLLAQVNSPCTPYAHRSIKCAIWDPARRTRPIKQISLRGGGATRR